MGLMRLFTAKGEGKKKENLNHANTTSLQPSLTKQHSGRQVYTHSHTTTAHCPVEGEETAPPLRRPSDPIALKCLDALETCVKECRLDRFFDQNAIIKIAGLISPMIPAIEHLTKKNWNVPTEALGNNLAYELCKLALFDVCIICDDSEASLVKDRQEDLSVCVRYMVEILRVLNTQPAKFRLVNSVYESDNLLTAEDVAATFRRISFRGYNGIAEALRARVNEKLVRVPLRANNLKKPVLAICLLTGRPVDGPAALLKVVTENPSDLIKYSIAQIGDDSALLEAINLVAKNTKHCDCTENYDLVAQSLLNAGVKTELSPELWIVKVLLGAIDKTYAGLATA